MARPAIGTAVATLVSLAVIIHARGRGNSFFPFAAASLGGSYFMCRLVERPSIELGKRFAR